MEQNPSPYQALKILLAEYLPVDRDILHIGIGLVLTLAAILVTRKSMRASPFLGAFALACLLGMGMEALDRRDDLRTVGAWRWKASVADFIRTVFFPAIALAIVAVFRRQGKD